MAIFKPQELTWEDIEGGFGERQREEIDAFVSEYCYEPPQSDSDEELANDLSFFEGTWDQLSSRQNIADCCQTAGVLSLIKSAFYQSDSRDTIKDALCKSATKLDLIEILVSVGCAYCQYTDLKARVAMALHEV